MLPSGDQEPGNSDADASLLTRTGAPPAAEDIHSLTFPWNSIRAYATRAPSGESAGPMNHCVVPAGKSRLVTTGRSPAWLRSQISLGPVRSVTYTRACSFAAQAGMLSLRSVDTR